MEYTTQMDAARKGIATPQMKAVAEKEHMPLEQLMRTCPPWRGAAWTALPWSPPSSPSRTLKPPAGSCAPWRSAL